MAVHRISSLTHRNDASTLKRVAIHILTVNNMPKEARMLATMVEHLEDFAAVKRHVGKAGIFVW